MYIRSFAPLTTQTNAMYVTLPLSLSHSKIVTFNASLTQSQVAEAASRNRGTEGLGTVSPFSLLLFSLLKMSPGSPLLGKKMLCLDKYKHLVFCKGEIWKMQVMG